MADAEDVRRLAGALPGAVEMDSDGFDFRVGGKGFVWSYPQRQPGRPRVIRTDVAVLFVGDEAEKQALLLGEPEVFFTAASYDDVPVVLLRLAAVDPPRLTELVTDAWRMRAGSEAGGDPCPPPAGSSTGPSALEFTGAVWFWRGPAPHHFVTVPDAECAALATASTAVSYGWGMIPVAAHIGQTRWTTSLFPKDGRYLVPIKVAARRAEGIEVGDAVTVRLVVQGREPTPLRTGAATPVGPRGPLPGLRARG